MKKLGILIHNNEDKSFFKKIFWKRIFNSTQLKEYQTQHNVSGDVISFVSILNCLCDYSYNKESDNQFLTKSILKSTELLQKKEIKYLVLDKFLLDFENRYRIIEKACHSIEIVNGLAVKACLLFKYLESLYEYLNRNMADEQVIYIGNYDFYAFRLMDLLASRFNFFIFITDGSERLVKYMYKTHGLSIATYDYDKLTKGILKQGNLIINNTYIPLESKNIRKGTIVYSTYKGLQETNHKKEFIDFDDIIIKNNSIESINIFYNNINGYDCCLVEGILKLAGYDFSNLYSQNSINVREQNNFIKLFSDCGFKIRGLSKNGVNVNTYMNKS